MNHETNIYLIENPEDLNLKYRLYTVKNIPVASKRIRLFHEFFMSKGSFYLDLDLRDTEWFLNKIKSTSIYSFYCFVYRVLLSGYDQHSVNIFVISDIHKFIYGFTWNGDVAYYYIQYLIFYYIDGI